MTESEFTCLLLGVNNNGGAYFFHGFTVCELKVRYIPLFESKTIWNFELTIIVYLLYQSHVMLNEVHDRCCITSDVNVEWWNVTKSSVFQSLVSMISRTISAKIELFKNNITNKNILQTIHYSIIINQAC